MPIYEYSCKTCGEAFEQLVKSPDIKINCPQCGGMEISRLFSAFAYRSRSGGSESYRSGSDGSESGISGSKSGCSSCFSRNCSHCS
jgi:putative FmdB family regulatory protein